MDLNDAWMGIEGLDNDHLFLIRAGENVKRFIDSGLLDPHHIQGHADGGSATTQNGAALCKDCHIKLHQ